MRLEFINKVKPGDVISKSILSNEGRVLLRSGVKLSSSYIKKLKELGVFYVYVQDDRLDDVNVEDERLTELKQVTIQSMSGIMKNVNNVNSRELKESLSKVEEMISYVVELGDVNKSLYDIKTFDNYTYIHSLDTCIMTAFLGMTGKYNQWDLKEMVIGAILHDIGKTKISTDILNKSGNLTKEEFEEVKKHTIYGAETLRKNITMPESIIKIVEQHHERVDGKGYPYGLTGNQISRFAKIVCVCDVYDAVSNDRCYRNKFTLNDSYELILSGAGTSFDSEVVARFKDTFSIYPLGCCVRLSNGDEGYVINQNKGFPDRPIIRILYDFRTKKPVPFYEIDLLKNPSIVIEGVV